MQGSLRTPEGMNPLPWATAPACAGGQSARVGRFEGYAAYGCAGRVETQF